MVGVVTTKLHDWLYAPFGNPMNTAYLGSVTSGYDQEMTFFERLKNTYIHNYVTFMFHYHVEAECEQVEKYMGRKISSIQDLYNDVSIVLVNSHYSLNDIKPSTPDIIEVGGIHVSPTGQELTPVIIPDFFSQNNRTSKNFRHGEKFPIDFSSSPVISVDTGKN